MEITIAHSPDADDAFMFYAIFKNKIDTSGFKFINVLKDIETLNRDAFLQKYDFTALSLHAYLYLTDKYQITSCGGSFGLGYGPIVIAKTKDTTIGTVAIPGELTTANLIFSLWCNRKVRKVYVPFDKIIDYVLQEKADAGVLIHEGQLTYERYGLTKIVDLGEFWYEWKKLPLPLGINAVKRSLDQGVKKKLVSLLRKSIEYAKDNMDQALEYSIVFGRELKGDTSKARRFVDMYVNRLTVDMGEEGKESIYRLVQEAYFKGLVKTAPENIEIIDG